MGILWVCRGQKLDSRLLEASWSTGGRSSLGSDNSSTDSGHSAGLFELQSAIYLLEVWGRRLRETSAVLGMSSHALQDHTDHKEELDKNSTG